MLPHVPRKSLLRGATGEGEYVVPYTARMKVEVGDQVSRGAALDRRVYPTKTSPLPFVMSCQLKLTSLRKYKSIP